MMYRVSQISQSHHLLFLTFFLLSFFLIHSTSSSQDLIDEDAVWQLRLEGAQPRSVIIIYTDGDVDHFEQLQRFMQIIPAEYHRELIDGRQIGRDITENLIAESTLAYFGRSNRDIGAWQNLPAPLSHLITEMPDYEGSMPGDFVPTLREMNTASFQCYTAGSLDQEGYRDLFAAFSAQDDIRCETTHYPWLMGVGTQYCDTINCSDISSRE